jgi:hypothetical protein
VVVPVYKRIRVWTRAVATLLTKKGTRASIFLGTFQLSVVPCPNLRGERPSRYQSPTPRLPTVQNRRWRVRIALVELAVAKGVHCAVIGDCTAVNRGCNHTRHLVGVVCVVCHVNEVRSVKE